MTSRIVSIIALSLVTFNGISFSETNRAHHPAPVQRGPHHYCSNMIPVMEIYGRIAGRMPKRDCFYDVQPTYVFQKVHGGYLLALAPWIQLESNLVYLKTTENLEANTLLEGPVYYYGEVEYTAINGFAKSVSGFKRGKINEN